MKIVIDGPDQVLYQWDKGQRLILDGISGPVRVDFTRRSSDRAVPSDSYTEDGNTYCEIPNSLLMENGQILVYIRRINGDQEETVFFDTLYVNYAPKPGDYVEPDEVLTWHELNKRIIALEQGGASGGYYTPAVTQPDANTMRVEYQPSAETMPAVPAVNVTLPAGPGTTPHIGDNGNWWIGDVDTGVKASPDYSQNATLTANGKALLRTLLTAAVYDSEILPDPATTIEAFLAELDVVVPDSGGGTDEPDVPDIPDEPDEPVKETFTVTYNLTDVASSNAATSVIEGNSFTTVLSAGSAIDTVKVTMGGVDITETAYNSTSGAVTIAEVTGNIVITASIADSSLLYTLKDASFNGSTIIDTGVALSDEPKDWTMLLDVKNVVCAGSAAAFVGHYDATNTFDTRKAFYGLVNLANKDTESEKCYVSFTAFNTDTGGIKTVVTAAGTATDRTTATRKWSGKIAITHDGATNTWSGYAINADTNEYVENSVVAVFESVENTVSIGGASYRGKTSFTCNEFSIYNRILSADEISAWMQ